MATEAKRDKADRMHEIMYSTNHMLAYCSQDSDVQMWLVHQEWLGEQSNFCVLTLFRSQIGFLRLPWNQNAFV